MLALDQEQLAFGRDTFGCNRVDPRDTFLIPQCAWWICGFRESSKIMLRAVKRFRVHQVHQRCRVGPFILFSGSISNEMQPYNSSTEQRRAGEEARLSESISMRVKASKMSSGRT
jgi:hypothetical protein